MDRWACVDVTALPLQLLLRANPQWADRPVVVVDEDKPNGNILWANRAAQRCNIHPGMRYAEGLSLHSGLCAGVVDGAQIEAAVAEVLTVLREFTPDVEASKAEPGVFWLDASGFRVLWPTLREWAEQVELAVRGLRFHVAVAVGFDRFATYALARRSSWSNRGERVLVFPNAKQERSAADDVPIGLLDLGPRLWQALRRLGITNVGQLRKLPAAGLYDRLGEQAFELRQLAGGSLFAPLDPVAHEEPAHAEYEIDPEAHGLDLQGLLFLVKSRLALLCQLLAERGEAITAVRLVLRFDRTGKRTLWIKPASSTLDEVELVDLLRLRLEREKFQDDIVGFEIDAESRKANKQQLRLFLDKPGRDLRDANRALARLRAEFGEQAVVRAVLREAHLPEARFGWEPIAEIAPAEPVSSEQGAGAPDRMRLVRRFLDKPRPVTEEPDYDGWRVGGVRSGPARELVGPYVVSGGWWHREVHRDYYFAETERGSLLWIYRDRDSRRWFVHGYVE